MKDIRQKMAIYNRANNRAIFNSELIIKSNRSKENAYKEEKKQMISKIVNFISNYHSKIKPCDFNLDVLNPWYLTNGDLKLIEDLLDKGLTYDEIKDFILKTWPQALIDQYTARQEKIDKSKERSLYIQKKHKKVINERLVDFEKYFIIEQCKTIQELLDNKGIDNKYKMDIARLLLNTLKNIKCNNCLYHDIVPSFTYCTENKCELTKEKCPDSSLFNDRMINCPYSEYEKKAKSFIKN